MAGKTESRPGVAPPDLCPKVRTMSTTETTHETISDAQPQTDGDSIATIATIAAETTSTVDRLPDWDVYTTACGLVKDSVERLAEADR